MGDNKRIDPLKAQLICLYCEVILPEKVLPGTFPENAERPEKGILSKALEGTKEKISDIILSMDTVNSAALRIRIPNAQYLRTMLRAEYMYHASISGRKGALRYASGNGEDESQVLRKFMCSYGFEKGSDLKKYEKKIRKYFKESGSDENQAYDTLCFMNHCLKASSSKE